MTFIHEDPDFSRLLAMVGEARNLDEPLVEKDYWIASSIDNDAESANLTIHYPGLHLEGLPTGISPFILLEAGDARVRPCLRRPISSMIHD
jgi:hypothetical protein